MSAKNKSYSLLASMVKKVVKEDANETSCTMIYQPKAPTALKQFSKVENDK